MSRLLKKCGFTPQKPIRRAYERNPEAVSYWMKTTYLDIQKRVQTEGAGIHWGDEMRIKNTDQEGRSVSQQGQTPSVSHTTKRFTYTMISTVTNSGTSRVMSFEESFTIDVFLKCLRKLLYKQDPKVYLILGNAKKIMIY